MKPFTTLALLPLLATGSAWAALQVPVASIEAANPSDFARVDELITYPISGLAVAPTEERAPWLTFTYQGRTIPSQVIDTNADGIVDTVAATYSFAPAEKAKFIVVADKATARANPFPRRAQADLSHKVGGTWNTSQPKAHYDGGEFVNVGSLIAPPEHTDHSEFIRYEGPGLESDKVAYRFYLDWRNGYDIFGKRQTQMALQQVGLEDFERYHHDDVWGMDILKVGSALGMGAPGYWTGKEVVRVSDTRSLQTRIVENGPIVASIKTDYLGWQADPKGERVDFSTILSMQAGSRLVKVQTQVANGKLDNVCTGIIQLPKTTVLKGNNDRTGVSWSYVATWGEQTLNGDDTLGMAVFYRVRDLRSVTQDALNHVVVLRPNSTYYFGGAWEGEPNGIKSEAEFKAWLEETVQRLERPLRTRVENGATAIALQAPLSPEVALNWSRALAESEMERYGYNLAYPNGTWNYTTGLLTESIYDLGLYTGEGRFKLWGQRVIDSFVTEEGDIRTYRKDEFNIDQVNSGKMLQLLSAATKDPRYAKAADRLYAQLQHHPKTSEGAFWHKQVYPWQVWLDGVYMGGPFYFRYLIENGKEAELDEALHEFLVVEKHLKDSKTGLYYHAWDEKRQQRWANPQTGLSPEFWARGLGWFAMALVDTMEILPADHPGQKDLSRILNNLAPALVKVQDAETGTWWQILDKPNATGNYREATASSMYVYTLAKACRLGYLDAKTYDAAIRKGYEGLLHEFMRVNADGTVTLTNNCQVAGYGRMESYDYYMTEQVIDDDPKGTGPFILAGIEVAEYLKSQK